MEKINRKKSTASHGTSTIIKKDTTKNNNKKNNNKKKTNNKSSSFKNGPDNNYNDYNIEEVDIDDFLDPTNNSGTPITKIELSTNNNNIINSINNLNHSWWIQDETPIWNTNQWFMWYQWYLKKVKIINS